MKNTPRNNNDNNDDGKKKPDPRARSTKRGRIVKTMEPWSPWQLLVTSRARDLKISTRALASAISTRDKNWSNATVWTWTRCPEGCPTPGNYTAQVNAAIAKALHIPAKDLAAAYDASRARFGPSAAPDGNKRLIHLRGIVADSTSSSWTKAELLDLIDAIINL
jgi:hypothetical protein